MTTITKRFQCRICPVSTTFTDEPAAIERLAAKLGWKPAATPAAPQACSNSCRAQALRDHANDLADGTNSMDGHEVERRQAAARLASGPTTTSARAQAEAAAVDVVIRLRCARGCGSGSEIVCRRDADGRLVPDPVAIGVALGFVEAPGGLACGAHCRDVMALEARRAGAPVVAVLKPIVPRVDAATVAQRRLASHPEPSGKPPRSAA